MVWMGRKAQLGCRGMDIREGNHPSRRRAFSPVFTRVANTSPNPGRRSVWTSSSQLGPSRDAGCSQHSSAGQFKVPLVRSAGNSGSSAGTSTPGHRGYIHPLLLHHGPLPRPGEPQFIPDVHRSNPPPLDHTRFFSSSACGSPSSSGASSAASTVDIPLRLWPGLPLRIQGVHGHPRTAGPVRARTSRPLGQAQLQAF